VVDRATDGLEEDLMTAKRKAKWIATATVATAAAGVAGCALASGGDGTSPAAATAESARTSSTGREEQLPDACRNRRGQKVEIATAKLIIENNATDEDIGVHGAFDDHGWSELCVFDPTGRPIAVFDPRGQLDDLTMAGVFFESREPPASEFSFEDLAAAFPEGQYRVRGRTFEGKVLEGRATFTHDVPAPPTITAPALAEEPERPGAPVPRRGLVVDWEPVTETVAGEPVNTTGYEVIVTKEDHDDPHGFSKPIYDVHVPADLDALRVPAEFLEPDTVYELEVLALEESGNQTISVGFFKTR
jgi:hypothetical protein